MGPLQLAECAELQLSKDVPAERRRYRNKRHEEIAAEKFPSRIKIVQFTDLRGITNPKPKKQTLLCDASSSNFPKTTD